MIKPVDCQKENEDIKLSFDGGSHQKERVEKYGKFQKRRVFRGRMPSGKTTEGISSCQIREDHRKLEKQPLQVDGLEPDKEVDPDK